jgi:hypothetical protein
MHVIVKLQAGTFVLVLACAALLPASGCGDASTSSGPAQGVKEAPPLTPEQQKVHDEFYPKGGKPAKPKK